MSIAPELWELAKSENINIKNNSIKSIIDAGYSYSFPGMIMYCIDNNLPMSLVRLGDGELYILAQEIVYSIDYIKQHVGWSHSTGYCGASVPSIPLRDRMIESIKNATVVGMFKNDPFNKEIFEKIGFYPKNICEAFENLYLPMRKDFVDIIRKYPPLLIGRKSQVYANYFKQILNVDIPACIGIESYREIDSVIEQAMKISDQWKWCLVSAGVPAVVIAGELDYKYGKVALDFGHSADNAIEPTWREYWFNTEV
jgi:hypothetical protein